MAEQITGAGNIERGERPEAGGGVGAEGVREPDVPEFVQAERVVILEISY